MSTSNRKYRLADNPNDKFQDVHHRDARKSAKIDTGKSTNPDKVSKEKLPSEPKKSFEEQGARCGRLLSSRREVEQLSFDELRLMTEFRDQLNATLDGVWLNEYGMPMPPLEIEVAKLRQQVSLGKVVMPKYTSSRKSKDGQWDNPIEYLQEIYGKYIGLFNKDGQDYIFTDDLEAIDPSFISTLSVNISRNKGTPYIGIGDKKLSICSIGDVLAPRAKWRVKQRKRLDRYPELKKNYIKIKVLYDLKA